MNENTDIQAKTNENTVIQAMTNGNTASEDPAIHHPLCHTFKPTGQRKSVLIGFSHTNKVL